MRLESAVHQRWQDRLAAHGSMAPSPYVARCIALFGDDPDRVASYYEQSDEGSHWHCVVLSGELLGRVSARSPLKSWTLNTDSRRAVRADGSYEAWAVPLRTVTKVSLTSGDGDYWTGDGAGVLSTSWQITLADGSSLDLLASTDAGDPSEQLARALLSVLAGYGLPVTIVE